MPVLTNHSDTLEEISIIDHPLQGIHPLHEGNNIQIENYRLNQHAVCFSDALNTVVKYHLDGKGRTRLSLELLKQSGLFVVSIFGVMFYYVPAKAYAESICADPDYKEIPCDFFIINHLTGTLLVAGGVLMTATNAFFDQINAEFIPPSLINYLKYPLSYKHKIAENIVIFTGSFIASVPFIILSITNPIPGLPKEIVVLQSMIIGLTNTLLHLLPFKLVLKNHWYRIPFLPFEFVVQKISHQFLSEEKKQEKELHKKLNHYYSLVKQRMIDRLDQALKLLSIYGFNFSVCGSTNCIAKDMRDIQKQDSSPLQLLTQLLHYIHQISPNPIHYTPSKLNNIFRKLIYFSGASWVILACSGFEIGTFSEINRLTGNLVSGSILSAPSIYCLGVLLAFFGGNALQNSYDYLTAWQYDSIKIPVEFKLYPKTSVILIIISTYLSFFSYAAGAQLIDDNFTGELEFLRPHLLQFMLKVSQTGLIFLGSTAMIDFVKRVLGKFEQYGYNEDTRTVACIFESFRQMKSSIQLFKPDLLLSSLADTDEDQLKSILNLQREKDREELKQTLLELKLIVHQKLLNAARIHENDHGKTEFINELLQWMSTQFDFTTYPKEAYIKLPKDLYKICEEYNAICKMIERLEKLNFDFDNESLLSVDHTNSNNEVYSAYGRMEPAEKTPLIPKKGSVMTRVYAPFRFYSSPSFHDHADSGRFSMHELSNSNYMRI